MKDQVEKYRAYARSIKRFLLLGGILPSGKERNTIYRLLPVVIVVSGIVVTCALGNSCLKHSNNLARLTKSLGLLISFVSVVCKTIIFCLYRKELIRLDKILGQLFEDALMEQRLRAPLLSHIRYFYEPIHFFAFLTMAALGMHYVKPSILLGIHFLRGTDFNFANVPFGGIYPWKIDSMSFYQLHFFNELQFAWFVLFVTSGVDTLLGFHVFQMSGLLRTMTFEMRNVQKSVDRKEVMCKCVHTHTCLMECRDILRRIYGPIVLIMVLTNALVMCTIIFQAFQLDVMTIDRAILFGFYVFMKMAQTFMYAWYGEFVTTESEMFHRAICYCGWYEFGDNGFTRSLVLIMMQKPIVLTAFNFIKISLDIFVRISNTTISYFFLLRTLEEK